MKKVMIFRFLTVIVAVFSLSVQYSGAQKVRNVIFLIGDGMGLAHVQAAMLNSGQALQLERAQFIGLAKTYSANNRVTDSAAAGTALATGYKTNNGMIGVTPDSAKVKNLRELAQENGLATGIVVTKSITDATPAAFLAHSVSRKNADDIALDIASSGTDVLFGGGKSDFSERADGHNLLKSLKEDGYTVISEKGEITDVVSGKVIGLFAKKHMRRASQSRDDYLPVAAAQALTILSNNNPNGFFLMIEGSQIDTGGHANDGDFVITETLDFDRAVGVAFDFADRNPGTLVVVTADHETGGLSLPSGDDDFMLSDRGIAMKFGAKGHSSIMVPVYAYGTGAGNFTTIMENTDIPKKIAAALGLSF